MGSSVGTAVGVGEAVGMSVGAGLGVGVCASRFASSFLTWAVTVAGMSGVGVGRAVGRGWLQASSQRDSIRARAVSLIMQGPGQGLGPAQQLPGQDEVPEGFGPVGVVVQQLHQVVYVVDGGQFFFSPGAGQFITRGFECGAYRLWGAVFRV